VSRGYDAYDPDKDREKDAPESKRYASFALANQNEHDHRQPAKHAQAVDENPIILRGRIQNRDANQGGEREDKANNCKLERRGWKSFSSSLLRSYGRNIEPSGKKTHERYR